MKKTFAVLFCALCCAGMLFPRSFAACAAETAARKIYTEQEILGVADGIIHWKKLDNGAAADGNLINNTFLEMAGSTPGDWFPIGLSRLGKTDDYAAYLAVVRDDVRRRYAEEGGLSASKATEWHRITLSVLAAGGDPARLAELNGKPVNLIADGTYDRGKTASLGRQGINGWIWGLIALDSKRYPVPGDAYNTRDDIIAEILRRQLPDGGFALTGDNSDPDITAMAIQALAPYYNSEKTYTYPQKAKGAQAAKTVRRVVDEAVGWLSSVQTNDGDFSSWGTRNAESTVQAAVALCALGIDPQADARFIKNGKSLLDGILKYRMPDGGFLHSFTYDAENPTSLPDKSNSMAGEQALYGLAAIWRQMKGLRILYDFRPEQSDELKARITGIRGRIAAVSAKTGKAALEELLQAYYALPENERNYVYNYALLSDAAKNRGIDILAISKETPVTAGSDPDKPDAVLLYFSEQDRAAAAALPEKLTTEQYTEVVKLLDKLENAEDFQGREALLAALRAGREKIVRIQAEIDDLNALIMERLYPFEAISLKDKKTVDAAVRRYEALSAYDRRKILRYEDVVKTKTQVDNLQRALVIAIVLLIAAAGGTVTVIWRIRIRRRKKREQKMPDITDEDDGQAGAL